MSQIAVNTIWSTVQEVFFPLPLSVSNCPLFQTLWISVMPTPRKDNSKFLSWKFPILTKNFPLFYSTKYTVMKMLIMVNLKKSLKIKHYQYYKSSFRGKLPLSKLDLVYIMIIFALKTNLTINVMNYFIVIMHNFQNISASYKFTRNTQIFN